MRVGGRERGRESLRSLPGPFCAGLGWGALSCVLEDLPPFQQTLETLMPIYISTGCALG